jgi:hypothetical protein
MKLRHTMTLSAATAILAAAIVVGLYVSTKPRHANPAKVASRFDARPPIPKEILNHKAPELPAAIRNAGKPPVLPKGLPSVEEMHEQFALLRHFLELPPERLARIRSSIESIERMPPERKKQMLERIRESDPTRERNARMEAPDSEADLRARANEFLDSLTDAEREAVNKRMKGLTKEERNVYLEGIAVGAAPRKNADDPFLSAPSAPSDDSFSR